MPDKFLVSISHPLPTYRLLWAKRPSSHRACDVSHQSDRQQKDKSVTSSENQSYDDDALLTPSEVAAMFRVNPKTVTRWARAGKISAIRTLGGHRRFRASEIRAFLAEVEERQVL
jgi:excisionase family DNA binding protein